MKFFRPFFPRIQTIAYEVAGTSHALVMYLAAAAQRLQKASKPAFTIPGESKLRSGKRECLENRLNTCLHG